MKISCDYHTIKLAKRYNPQNPITAAFNSIKKAVQASEHTYVDNPEDAEVIFVFGSITQRKLETERAKRILHHKMKFKKIFSLDSSFFSTYIRNHVGSPETYMFRVGYRDCTGTGDFLNKDSNDERYKWFKEAFNFEEKEPRIKNDAPILFLLQSEKGWQYNSMQPYHHWARGVVEQLRRLTTRQIILRGHPNPDRNPIYGIGAGLDNVRYTQADRGRRTLFDDLEGAGAVITHSSSAVIESAVEGIPSFALDPRCVIYPYLEHQLGKINFLEDYDWSWREQALKDWAYTSWHVKEMENPAWIDYYMNKIK
jgi:hypothetical protein